MHGFLRKKFALLLLLAVPALPAPAQTKTAQTKPSHDAADPAPLPDIATLLHQVEIARQHNTTLAEQYFYDATRTAVSGGKTMVETSEISYINGVRIERLIARGGKPLSPEEADKENARVNKAVAKAKAKTAEEHEKGVETDSNGNQLITLDRLMELYTLTNERREMVNGRSSIAIDFAGNPAAKTHSMAESILHTFSGTVWIDERDHQVAKMSGISKEGYRAGLGLVVNISKGLGGTVEWAPVGVRESGEGEVWLPARLQGQGHIRVLLFDDALDGSETDVFSNYHKFETDVKVLPAPDGSGADAPAPDAATPDARAKP